MKKKKTDFKKLSLSKKTIANVDKVNGGIDTENIPTLQGNTCVTCFFTACEGPNCFIFDTQNFACRTRL